MGGAFSCGDLVFLVRSPHDDFQRVVRQRPLQRLGLIPGRAHPDVALPVRHHDDWYGLRMDRLDDGIRRCREKTIDLMRPRDWLGLGAAIPSNVVQMPAKANNERSSLRANQTNLFLGFRVQIGLVFGDPTETSAEKLVSRLARAVGPTAPQGS